MPDVDVPPSPPPAGADRTGAVWVTALGAFMLLAAATVFVAVRWQELTDAMKLGVLAALTGACLLAGRLRSWLPGTAGVLFHLGAFLVPVDIAAVAVHLGTDWPVLLLVEGVSATAIWALLAVTERSRILGAAAAGAAVVAAAGASATVASQTGHWLPTALIVAVGAVAAEVVASRRSDLARGHGVALAWALVAGLAPVLGLVERAVPLGTDLIDLLGLSGRGPGLTAALSGLLAAGVVGRIAARRGDLILVVVAGLIAVVGVGSAWIELAPGADAGLVGLATVFLLIEVAAAALAGDGFWDRPARVAAGLAEIVAGLAGAAALADAVHQFATQPSRIAWGPITAGVVAAAAWLVADLRRVAAGASGERRGPGAGPWALLIGAGWAPATIGATAAVMAGVLAGTREPTVVAVLAVLLAAVVVVSGRTGGHAVAAGLVLGGTLAHPAPPVLAGAGVAGALILGAAAVVRAWRAAPAPPPAARPRAWSSGQSGGAWLLAIAALTNLYLTALLLPIGPSGSPFAVAAGLVLAATALAAVLDRAPGPVAGPRLSAVGRVGAVLVLAPAAWVFRDQWELLAVLAGLVASLALIDALRLHRPGPLWALPAALPVLVGAGVEAATHSWSSAGVGLSLLAAGAALAHVLVDRLGDPQAWTGGWSPPLLATCAVAAAGAAALTAPSPVPFATVVVVLGATAMLLGAAHRSIELIGAGGLVATTGVWLHLAAAGVDALDAYAAPVALAMVVAGWRIRRPTDRSVTASTIGSWVAYAPAVVLLGGTALVERVHGGHGVHALAAGAVGLAAVVAGGWRRLAGPLMTGTLLLVGLTVHESLGVTRQVPTWGWLAMGGAVLVITGVVMDRRETGPAETGRRLVDVVHERFS